MRLATRAVRIYRVELLYLEEIMDPITTALVGGSTFVLKGIASEALKDAYKGLKDILVDALSSLTNLEDDPTDVDYRKATAKELLKKGLAEDPMVLEKASELTRVIAQEPPETLASAGINIGEIQAAQNIIITRLRTAGSIHVTNVRSEHGSINIGDISTSIPGKTN